MAYDFVQFLFMFFDDWKFNYELIFFYQKWPKDFMETLWRESWAAFFLVLLEGYWINFNDRLGFVLLLSSLKDFSWTSFLYSFNLTIALNAFWITAPFVTPWFWFNFVLFFVEKFKLDEIYWAWFLFNHYDAFRLEWSLGAFEDINSILLHESIIQIASTGRGEDHPINFRDLISKDEFNNYVNNYFFLQLSELKPVLGRESSEAPFSFLSPNGLIVYSLNEVMFLSDIFMARQFKKDLYYAVDFFKIYNKDKNSDDLFVWLDYVPYAENKKYPYKSLSANDYLVPKFTFLTEIGPDFYLNLRKYEESFSLPYFRYFFHRYQELVTHVLSKGSVFEKELSETVLERKYLYGGVSHVIIAYDPSKESNVVLTLDGKGKRAVVVQDIYGNIIYFNVYRRKF